MFEAEAHRKPQRRITRWHSAFRDASEALRATQANACLVIRPAGAADLHELGRLSQLDSKTVAAAPYVVAEIGGELIAAVPVGGGDALADPFRPTADLVSLLELRATQLNAAPGRARIAA